MLRENQLNSTEPRIHRHCFVLMALNILVAGATASLAADKIELAFLPQPSDFSIDKAEKRQSDDVYATYCGKTGISPT